MFWLCIYSLSCLTYSPSKIYSISIVFLTSKNHKLFTGSNCSVYHLEQQVINTSCKYPKLVCRSNKYFFFHSLLIGIKRNHYASVALHTNFPIEFRAIARSKSKFSFILRSILSKFHVICRIMPNGCQFPLNNTCLILVIGLIFDWYF